MTGQVQVSTETGRVHLAEKSALLNAYKYPLIIIVVGVLAYANSFEGEFVLDDRLFIINRLKSLWDATFGGDNMSRPLVGLSLHLNYLISGFNIWSYHLFNLLVHLSAGLALFGIVHRTLQLESLRDRFKDRARPLALIVALLWMVHPLQTQAVTYIIQRGESMMGLFYLLTLYAALRGFIAGKPARWFAIATLTSAAGMLSKQVMVTAPVVVLVFDYLFISASLKEAWRKHWHLYAGLFATWGLLALTFALSPVNETAGFAVKKITPLAYYLSEFRVILHYLRLAVFPDSLSIDYGWKPASGPGEILPFAIPVVLLQAATLWGLVKRKPLAFLGVWFFGILALTTTLMPFADLVFEHRMYLPLAAVVMAFVLGADRIMQSWLSKPTADAEKGNHPLQFAALAIVSVLILTLTVATVRRNMDYKSELVLWLDTLKKQPENPRALVNVGAVLVQKGELELATPYFTRALAYDPDYLSAHLNYGSLLLQSGKIAESLEHFRQVIALNPKVAHGHYNLGKGLFLLGKTDEAIEALSKTVELQPDYVEAHYLLGVAFEKQGNAQQALAAFQRSLQLNPNNIDAMSEIAVLLTSAPEMNLKNTEMALQLAETAVRLTGKRDGKSLDALGRVYAELRRYNDAVAAAKLAADSPLAKQDNAFAADLQARLKSYQEKARPASANGAK